jgi:N utilization substance protein B
MSENQRHLARVIVLKALYATEHGDLDPIQAFDDISSEEKLSKKNLNFAKALYDSVRTGKTKTDNNIEMLSENWDLDRIAAVDRYILQMAITELELFVDTPVKVVLNEAIELAKEFSTSESSSFINGILDSFVKSTDQLSTDK